MFEVKTRKAVVLSESTLVVLRAAETFLKFFTNDVVREFRYATLHFHDHEKSRQQAVHVAGMVVDPTKPDKWFKITVLVHFHNVEEFGWLFDERIPPLAIIDGTEIWFTNGPKGLEHQTESFKRLHEEIIKRYGLSK